MLKKSCNIYQTIIVPHKACHKNFTAFEAVYQEMWIYFEIIRLIHNNYFHKKHGTYYIFIKNYPPQGMPQNLFHNFWNSQTGDMIFARLHRIWNLNKRVEGNVESLTAGPTCQRHWEQRAHSTVGFSGGSKDMSVLPESFRVDIGRWFEGWSNGARSPLAMAARRGYPGLRRSSPTGRASGKGSLSISKTAWSFLGRKA